MRGHFCYIPIKSKSTSKKNEQHNKTFRKTTDLFPTITAKHNPTSYTPFPCARQVANPSAFILLQTHAFRATKRPISSSEMNQIVAWNDWDYNHLWIKSLDNKSINARSRDSDDTPDPRFFMIHSNLQKFYLSAIKLTAKPPPRAIVSFNVSPRFTIFFVIR